VYQSLPDTITVYRGVIGTAEDSYLGLSWSLNQETAEWFAKRFGHRGYVYEGQIDKKYVYAYFSGRNESEVVIRPKYLRGLKKRRAMYLHSPCPSYAAVYSACGNVRMDGRQRYNRPW